MNTLKCLALVPADIAATVASSPSVWMSRVRNSRTPSSKLNRSPARTFAAMSASSLVSAITLIGRDYNEFASR